MCGIVGFCGKKQALDTLISGLERLEYRGYDSSGVAIIRSEYLLQSAEISVFKTKGCLKNLKKLLARTAADLTGSVGIGHTRWATHGAPTDQNAHPHLSESGNFAIVHAGIIENYAEIKEFLCENGYHFVSQTDSEVAAHLLDFYYDGDAVSAIKNTAERLSGSYSLAVLCAHTPEKLYAYTSKSPLAVGLGTGETFLASDTSTYQDRIKKYILTEAGEIAILTAEAVKVVNLDGKTVKKTWIGAGKSQEMPQKDGFDHFMQKEIYQQPAAVSDTLGYLKKALPTIKTLKKPKKLTIIGCGSALNAGKLGKEYIENLCAIPTDCWVASEICHKNPALFKDSALLAISQSGETADTLAAVRSQKSSPVVAIVNAQNTTLERDCTEFLQTEAGAEVAVPTTKCYAAQAATMLKIALNLYKNSENCDKKVLKSAETDLAALPGAIASLLSNAPDYARLSATLFPLDQTPPFVYFLGRGADLAAASEGALKLKEVSYIPAESYGAGELKHGTISLIRDSVPVVMVSTDSTLAQKTVSSIREIQSRGGVVLSVTSLAEVAAVSDHSIKIEGGFCAPILAVVAMQQLAYHTAKQRGCEIDRPRNLSKSVTAE